MDLSEEKNYYNKLGVHDLRFLARSYGISHPTMKKKEELIEEILDVVSGKVSPRPPSNRGRKTIAKLASNDFNGFPLELASKMAQRAEKLKSKKANVFEFHQPTFSDFVFYENKIGYLVDGEDWYFIDEESNCPVFVPYDLVKNFSLQKGDRIEVKTASSNEKSFVAKDVLLINGLDANKTRTLVQFSDVEIFKNPITTDILLEGMLFELFQKEDFSAFDFVKNSLDDFCMKGAKIVFLATSMSIMDLMKYKNLLPNQTFLVTLLEQQPIYSFENITNAINYVSALACAGEKIVLFIPEMSDILKDLDYHFASQGEGYLKHYYSTIDIFRKLVGLHRTLKNGGSVTTIFATKYDEFGI